MRLAAAITLCASLVLALGACGGGPGSAEEAVEELFSKAQDGDYAGACELYSDQLIEEDYDGSTEDCEADIREAAEADPEFLDSLQVTGSQPGDDGVTEVTYNDGSDDEGSDSEIEVQEIDGEWQIVEQ